MTSAKFVSVSELRQALAPVHAACLESDKKLIENKKLYSFGYFAHVMKLSIPMKKIAEKAGQMSPDMQASQSAELFSQLKDDSSSDIPRIKLKQDMEAIKQSKERLSTLSAEPIITRLRTTLKDDVSTDRITNYIEQVQSQLNQAVDRYDELHKVENAFFSQYQQLENEHLRIQQQQLADERTAIEKAELKKIKRKSLVKKALWTTGFISLLFIFFITLGQ